MLYVYMIYQMYVYVCLDALKLYRSYLYTYINYIMIIIIYSIYILYCTCSILMGAFLKITFSSAKVIQTMGYGEPKIGYSFGSESAPGDFIFGRWFQICFIFNPIWER